MFWGISKKYICTILFTKNWIAFYVRNKKLSFKRKVVRYLPVESNMEKKNWHMMKDSLMKGKIGRELILIILIFFSLISQSFLSSSNIGASSLWFVSVFQLSTPICRNFKISMTCLYPNTFSIQYMFEIQVSLLFVFFLGSFAGFFWISDCIFTL